MASLSPSHCSCLLLLVLVVLAASSTHGSTSISHVLEVNSLFPGQSCSSPKDTASTSRLKIVHQHGACSPLTESRRKPPSHAQILAADESRVRSIHRRASAKPGRTPKHAPPQAHPPPAAPRPSRPTSASSIPATSGLPLGTGNYVVTICLGTPAKEFTVVFDTASDVTWVQCEPCVVPCYKQRDVLFDPAKSSTYGNISCSSPHCSELYANSCTDSTCLYGVQYGDGSYSVGFYAQDTLTLSHDVLKAFRFGCGEKNKGLFGQTAGLLGLSRGKPSLTEQAYAKYGGVFSYCLPATTSGTGFLTFGVACPTANAKFTPMLTDQPTFYFVNLTGISVGGQQLDIQQSVFAVAGTIVDSGTVITRLPPDAYTALRLAFRRAMSSYNYKLAPAFSILDTCYDFTGLDDVKLPTVELVFGGGASLDVDVSGIMYAASISQVCLAFAANDDNTSVAIVGNTQQKTYGVVYDVAKKVVGFNPAACM